MIIYFFVARIYATVAQLYISRDRVSLPFDIFIIKWLFGIRMSGENEKVKCYFSGWI